MPGIDSAAADFTEVPFDPFELKDVVGGNIRDPYPVLHDLCRQSPVHTGPIDLGEGAEIADPTRPPPVTVFGFDEAVQVLRDNETYSSAVYADVMGWSWAAPSCRWTSPSTAASGPSWHRASAPRCSNAGRRTSSPSS